MPEQIRYAVSIVATRGTIIRHGVRVVSAYNQEHAEGIGLQKAREFAPIAEGWSSHDAVADPIQELPRED